MNENDTRKIANFNIRAAKDTDTIAIKGIVFSVLKEYGLTPDEEDTDQDLASVESFYFENGGYFAVVEDEGKIIASTGLHKIDSRRCELRKMYMLPEYRGRGLGRQLLSFSIDKARAMGFEVMTLETASVLKEAIALYEKFGFEKHDSANLVSRCDQAYQLSLNSPGNS